MLFLSLTCVHTVCTIYGIEIMSSSTFCYLMSDNSIYYSCVQFTVGQTVAIFWNPG